MDIERHFLERSPAKVNGSPDWHDLPPTQAGLAAALRKAFVLPEDESERHFEALLQKLG